MKLGDISSIFSRYFVVGFFLPAFFGLVTLWQTLSADFPPNKLRYGDGGDVAVLGGIALLVALLLTGMRQTISNYLRGYTGVVSVWVTLLPYWVLHRWQRHVFSRLQDRRAQDDATAAVILDRYFPDEAAALRPTRFGNAYEALELYAYTRYGLDRLVWPRIRALLSDRELEQHTDLRTDLAMFVNFSLVAGAMAIPYFIDWVHYRGLSGRGLGCWLGSLAVSYAFLRLATSALAHWGDEVRVGVDINRRVLYEKLGLVDPKDDEEERRLAAALNGLLAYSRPIPERYRCPTKCEDRAERGSGEKRPTS
jgi:hypothetical protein